MDKIIEKLKHHSYELKGPKGSAFVNSLFIGFMNLKGSALRKHTSVTLDAFAFPAKYNAEVMKNLEKFRDVTDLDRKLCINGELCADW